MSSKKKGEPEFEKTLGELEVLVQELEDGSLSLDESLEKYARAKECLDFCRKKLSDAELKINRINETGSAPTPLNIDEE